MFHLAFAIPGLLVICRTIWPMPWAMSAKIAAAILILLLSQYHLYSRISSGSVFSAEMPRGAIIGFNWAFSAILILALLQILIDMAALLVLLANGKPEAPSAGVRYAISVLSFVLAAIGVQAAIRVPPLRDVKIEIPNLPPAFEGYTIVQLTDMHISRLFPAAWTSAVVRDTNVLQPDLIVITGDLIDGTIAQREADVAPLRGLRAADGVFAIPGNHEYFFDPAAWMRQFATLGMTTLENSHTVIERRDGSLVLAGMTDLSASETGFPVPDLERALAGAPPAVPIILLDHQPKNARVAAARGVALQLSGHTHGGLVVGLERIFALANGGFVSGKYDVDAMTLYVNNGTALWGGLALRLGKPSELTRVTLTRKLKE
ncbi:metallophosphoesterase [Oxalobacteraceae bacterium OTU3CINTB1]|nr:metallophosphoesterase [Oxalobacteraceae bacterium OTU3CINTB1]